MASKVLLEMQRSALDNIRVHNPTAEEYVVEWDKANTNTPWIIPSGKADKFNSGRGNREVPRYIALKFLKEITDIIIEKQVKAEWKKLRKEYGRTEQVAKEEERLMTSWRQDPKRRKEIAKTIWLGVAKRHGDLLPEREEQPSIDRSKSMEQQIIDELDLDQNVKDEFVSDIGGTDEE